MKPVVDGGHIYLAKPPLFELVKQAAKTASLFMTRPNWKLCSTKRSPSAKKRA